MLVVRPVPPVAPATAGAGKGGAAAGPLFPGAAPVAGLAGIDGMLCAAGTVCETFAAGATVADGGAGSEACGLVVAGSAAGAVRLDVGRVGCVTGTGFGRGAGAGAGRGREGST